MRHKQIRVGIAASILLMGVTPPLAAAASPKPAEVISADRQWAADGPGGVPSFTRHVQPLLGRLGCSNRACHGSFQGQGGFRQSLFGSDPRLDHDGLVKEGRIDVKDPAESLALLKPTRQVSHKGGQRFEKDGWEHRLLRAWIAAGAPYVPDREAVLPKLEIVPGEIVLPRQGARELLRVRAHFADQTVEDVTALTQFASNDEAIAAVTDKGQVMASRPGDTAIVASYGGAVCAVPVLVPLPGGQDRSIPFPPNNRIDELVAAKLQKLGMVPSELCTDEEFLRRVSLDITGTLPTPQEVLAFRADPKPDRRVRKIDELLGRPAYAVWWTTRLCDLTGLNQGHLGHTDFARLVAEQWQAWIQRRVRDNVGYDQLVAGILLAVSRQPGQGYEAFAREMSTYTRQKNAKDFSDRAQMPWFWFRDDLNDPQARALKVAHAFLGVRLECAQCHKHPFDRWTQQDFQQFTALFERIQTGIAPDAQADYDRLVKDLGITRDSTAAQRRGLYLRLAQQGEPAPWREVYVGPATRKRPPSAARPKLLGGIEVDSADDADPRAALVGWLREPNNPYFARAWVNRVWAHYFGKGIVDPPDDHNLGNPASNPELLQYLAAAFVARGYDMKWLHREIVGSRTYQLSWKPNAANRDDERNFSRAYFRRLPAEVVVDALRQTTASSRVLARVPIDLTGRRIGQQAVYDERRTEYPLVIFGKPLRKVNCDCERIADPSLLQAVFLRNDREILALLDRSDGWLKELAAKTDPDGLIREAYLRTLSRLPEETELVRCRQHLAGARNPTDGLRDLLWALLNTQEFITNH
jgi:hypothetical protein